MEMNGINLKKCLLFLFIVLNFSGLYAQDDDVPEGSNSTFPPGTAIIDNQRATHLTSASLALDEYCMGNVVASVYTTNLEIDNDLEAYVLPPDATPIYLRYSIAGQDGISPVTQFHLYNDPEYPDPPTQVYESKIIIPIEFANTCASNSSSNENSNPENSNSMAITFSIELKDIVNGEELPYPFQLNDHSEGIFSCQIFCTQCPDPEGGEGGGGEMIQSCLQNEYFSGWGGSIVINCGECTNVPGEGVDVEVEETEENEDEGGGYIQIITPPTLEQNKSVSSSDNMDAPVLDLVINKTTSNVKVIPNPTQSIADIVFQGQVSETIEIIIYDASGQVVYREKGESNTGINYKTISLDDWKAGLYFGQIRSNSNNQLFKIVKIK